ncbi:MAG: hypothetical protein HYX28_00915 [Candidatus Koribacter versatilis]|uniref:Uncharacterized protein n=1 Tax=Candidatus Korobacter versatilis TaxID=658062 RepID=A0A932A602_9BACT|nr:hypothetical protein [Candidatus Koribacter versatilis]
MADVVRNLEPRRVEREEQYWSPSLDRRPVTASEAEICSRCRTEFIIGSRFCYVCGADRDLPGRSNGSRADWKRWLAFTNLQQRMGLGAASLVAFIVGSVCVFAAVLTGLMFTATTMIDWQAVQLWRMEWLLAAIAAFVAGIQLKRTAKVE